ncbi:hypothetical protein X753_31260 [Mesorhizobium sp. LNJC399B00]|nr:hypothetical protein X753_31260 [Mesorhizobium sp. LNJC399B00]
MQSNVTTVEVSKREVSKCVCTAVELPRKSGLHCGETFEEYVGITKEICRKPPIVQSSVKTVLIF